MLSQSGLCVLRGGLAGYGIESSEHAAVDFTLSRNAATGDVTIRYSSPKELPFSFEWSATIKPDGYVSTTPLRFLGEQQTANCKAGVEEAVKSMQNPRGTHNLCFENDKARRAAHRDGKDIGGQTPREGRFAGLSGDLRPVTRGLLSLLGVLEFGS